MLKVIWLLKRKEGTTFEQLMEHYESRHSVLAKKIFDAGGFAPLKYVRKYFRPVSDLLPFADQFSGSDFDMAMEMWFEDRAHFDRMLEVSSPEDIWRAISDDEARFMDMDKRAIYVLEEHETLFDQ